MTAISAYTFNKNFSGVTSLTQRQALDYGITDSQFTAADKNNDGSLSVDEILANDEICDVLMKYMANAAGTTKTNEADKTKSAAPQAEAQPEENTNNTETATGEKLSYEA